MAVCFNLSLCFCPTKCIKLLIQFLKITDDNREWCVSRNLFSSSENSIILLKQKLKVNAQDRHSNIIQIGLNSVLIFIDQSFVIKQTQEEYLLMWSNCLFQWPSIVKITDKKI